MRDEFALRYLLLKVLNQARGVAPDVRREVADGLRIVREGDAFQLTWVLEGTKRETVVPRERFTFYRRGDRPGSAPAIGYDIQRQNFANAVDVVGSLLDRPGLDVPRPGPGHPRLDDAPSMGPGWWWLAPVAAAAAGGLPVAPLATSVAACLLLERLQYRALAIGGVLAAVAAWLGTPGGAISTGVGLLGVAVLSPRPQARGLIATGGAVAMAAGGLACIARFGAGPALTASAWPVAAMCLVTALTSWMFGTHRELMPLVLPLVGVGLAFDGFALAALALGAGPAAVLIRRVAASRPDPRAPGSHPTPP